MLICSLQQTRLKFKIRRVVRNKEMCHFFFLWGVNVSLTSRCVHQQRHLENRELLHTSSPEGFSTTFLRLPPSPSWGYLYFSLGNTSMMTLRLIPDVRGKNCVKLWLLDPNWAQMCFSYSRFCSILFQVCSLHSALLCAEAFFWDFCSTV